MLAVSMPNLATSAALVETATKCLAIAAWCLSVLSAQVRAVWAFVEGLDLRALHDAVKAREGVPGQAPPAPELMMALWLWATVDGVGSARQLARMCEQHLAYRWLCGGVSMNYHTLSDFRVAHTAVLDQLLAGGVAALVGQGLVALDVLAQDGLRVRAAAGGLPGGNAYFIS